MKRCDIDTVHLGERLGYVVRSWGTGEVRERGFYCQLGPHALAAEAANHGAGHVHGELDVLAMFRRNKQARAWDDGHDVQRLFRGVTGAVQESNSANCALRQT